MGTVLKISCGQLRFLFLKHAGLGVEGRNKFVSTPPQHQLAGLKDVVAGLPVPRDDSRAIAEQICLDLQNMQSQAAL